MITARTRMELAMMASGTRVRITRAPVGTTFDPVTGNITSGVPETIYDGPALVTALGLQEREALRGGEQESQSRYQVSVPLVASVKIGDEITVTACTADPNLVEHRMWAAQLPSGSAVARRRILAAETVVVPSG